MARQPSLSPSRLICAVLLCSWLVHPMPRVYAAEDLCEPDPTCSAWSERGKQSFFRKDYAKAIDAYQHALAIKPEPRLLLNIGRCHHWLSQYDEALRAYQQLTSQSPSLPLDFRQLVDRYIQEAEAGQREQNARLGGSLQRLGTTETTTIPPTPVYKKWWFWTILAAVAAGAIGGGLGGGLANRPPNFSETVSNVH